MAARIVSIVSDLPPELLALTVVVGLVLGTFPVPGGPTVLCTLAALRLRLHMPAIQVVNQVSTPAQIALMLPFARLGSWAIGPRAGIAGAAAHAFAGWLCAAVPLGALLYLTLLWLLRARRV